MSLIKRNIAANFIGTFWTAIMSMIFIPLYIKFLGIESWGVIGIFTTLQAVMVLFDMGLSAALTRELSRLSVIPGKEQEMRNLVRSMEIVYWGIAIVIGLIIISLSHFIAYKWVNPGQLSSNTIERAILFMGFVMVIQWPGALYSGGLMGLQKQVLLNIVNIILSTLRGVGAVLILWLISPTIEAFFIWQIIISGLNSIFLYKFLWQKLPASNQPSIFNKQILIGIWKFAAGISGISLLAMILTQLDKIILSKVLSLEVFGYYTFASMVAMSLGRLFTPVFFSIYPKLTQLAAAKEMALLKQFYHQSCQFMAVLILPIALVVAFFSYDIVLLWTNNSITAEKTHLLISILICGTAINGIMNPPYALQLAYGWTKLNFFTNGVAVIVLIPLLYFMANKYGAIGAASVWLLLNIGYVIFLIPLMHRKLLQGEKLNWYIYDLLLPALAGLSVVILGRFFYNENASQLYVFCYIAVISTITLFATLFSVPKIKEIVISQILMSRFKIFKKQ